MRPINGLLTGLVLGLILLVSPAAGATDFSITKDVAAGTFTFTDDNPNDPVFEVVVAGLGSTAGTTQPGFSATAFLFNDPLNCQPAIGSTITSGFCYVLTDPAASPIVGPSTTIFTYDSEFDDPTVPSEFAVAFDLPNGMTGACFGNTGPGDGCNAPVPVSAPEPASAQMILTALVVLLGLLAWRRCRPAPGAVPPPHIGTPREATFMTMNAVSRLVPAALGLLASLALLAAKPAEARLTRIVIDSTTTTTIGSVTYNEQVGRIFGELDPNDPHNTVIQDIGLASLDANNKVPYAATITILAPQTGATGVMLYQVSNRGGQGFPNPSTVEPGATYVWTGWQGDLLAKPCITDYPCSDLYAGPYSGSSGTHVLQVPVAHNPGNTTITGPAFTFS